MAEDPISPIRFEDHVLVFLVDYDSLCFDRNLSQVVQLLDSKLGLERDSYSIQDLRSNTITAKRKLSMPAFYWIANVSTNSMLDCGTSVNAWYRLLLKHSC
jgi:hypothetical protein